MLDGNGVLWACFRGLYSLMMMLNDNEHCTPCLKELCKIVFFCHKFVKWLPNLIIFGTQIAQRIGLREVHSFSTTPNQRQHTTVLNVKFDKVMAKTILLSFFETRCI